MFGFGDIFGGGAPPRRCRSGRRSALRPRDHVRGIGQGRRDDDPDSAAETCETCHGTGAAPGSAPPPCPQCQGQGQVRFQQGFFTVARTCPQCRGAGKIITKPCPTCRGEGARRSSARSPSRFRPASPPGQQLRLQGEGEGGLAGGPAGDLYVVVHVQEHAVLPARRQQSVLRDPGELHDARARRRESRCRRSTATETYKMPEGTQSGTTFRLRGKGMPDVSGRGRGDLFLAAQAVTPKKLTKEQRPLLEQLAKALPKEKFEPRAREARRRATRRTCSTRSKICLARAWPALDIHVPGCDPQLQELVLAELDDFHPTAIQEPDEDDPTSSARSSDRGCPRPRGPRAGRGVRQAPVRGTGRRRRRGLGRAVAGRAARGHRRPHHRRAALGLRKGVRTLFRTVRRKRSDPVLQSSSSRRWGLAPGITPPRG